MTIPANLRARGTVIGWIVFIFLLLPVLIFALGVGFSDGFTAGRVAVALAELAVIVLAAWLLGRGLSRGSRSTVLIAALIILLILVAYGAAVALLIGGLKIQIF